MRIHECCFRSIWVLWFVWIYFFGFNKPREKKLCLELLSQHYHYLLLFFHFKKCQFWSCNTPTRARWRVWWYVPFLVFRNILGQSMSLLLWHLTVAYLTFLCCHPSPFFCKKKEVEEIWGWKDNNAPAKVEIRSSLF